MAPDDARTDATGQRLGAVLPAATPSLAELWTRLCRWIATTRRSYYDENAATTRSVAVLPDCQRTGCDAAAEYTLPARRLKADFCLEHFPTPVFHDVRYARITPVSPDGGDPDASGQSDR